MYLTCMHDYYGKQTHMDNTFWTHMQLHLIVLFT
jgi:hypothetical protein